MPSSRPSDPTLLVFLKAPRKGDVKTRLAALVGAARATAIYRRLVARQLATLPPEWSVEIHYTPRGARAEMVRWLGARRTFRAQTGVDLGARLTRAFACAFARGATRVIAIGADCPTLDASCLRRAAAALQKDHDVVLGPARDGGYYLIGLRRITAAPELFTGIPWGTGGVLAATRERARAARLAVAQLEVREDVDDLASWRRNARHVP